MKTGIIIQARMGSSRLPGKVLKPLPFSSTEAVIGQIIHRASLVKNADAVIVASSLNEENTALIEWLSRNKPEARTFCGSEDDVLDRFYEAALRYELDTVVRLTGDNPCIDAEIIESTITQHVAMEADYTCTKGYPLGMNVEVISMSALRTMHEKATAQDEREHVTPYIKRNESHFRIIELKYGPIAHGNIRLTLDTPNDYLMMCVLFDYMNGETSYFSLNDVLQLQKSHPFIFEINQREQQKKIYHSIKEELMDACQLLQLQEMPKAASFIKAAIEKQV